MSWQALKCDGQSELPVRVSRKLGNEGVLYGQYASSLLRMQLDGVLAPRWADGHVTVGALWDDFARYVYLPRLPGLGALCESVKAGPSSLTWETDGFATADAFDDGVYRGLVRAEHAPVVTAQTLVVRPEIAKAQPAPSRENAGGEAPVDGSEVGADHGGTGAGAGGEEPDDPTLAGPRRFYASVELDPLRLNRDFGKVAEEVVAHLTGLLGTDVSVTVEIQATNDEPFPDAVVRTVAENAKTLKFKDHGFEER